MALALLSLLAVSCVQVRSPCIFTLSILQASCQHIYLLDDLSLECSNGSEVARHLMYMYMQFENTRLNPGYKLPTRPLLPIPVDDRGFQIRRSSTSGKRDSRGCHTTEIFQCRPSCEVHHPETRY